MRLFWDGLSEVKDNLLAWPHDKDLAALIGCQREIEMKTAQKKHGRDLHFFTQNFEFRWGLRKRARGVATANWLI